MSRMYEIRVSESQTVHVHVDDKLEASVPMIAILPPERMGALLGEALESQGYEVNNGRATSSSGNVKISVELSTGKILVEAVSHQETVVEVEKVGRGDDDFEHSAQEERVRDAARREIEHRAEALREQARKELEKELEAALEAARPVLDQAVVQTTKAALVEKARSMGSIKSVSESGDEMTIKLEV